MAEGSGREARADCLAPKSLICSGYWKLTNLGFLGKLVSTKLKENVFFRKMFPPQFRATKHGKIGKDYQKNVFSYQIHP